MIRVLVRCVRDCVLSVCIDMHIFMYPFHPTLDAFKVRNTNTKFVDKAYDIILIIMVYLSPLMCSWLINYALIGLSKATLNCNRWQLAV